MTVRSGNRAPRRVSSPTTLTISSGATVTASGVAVVTGAISGCAYAPGDLGTWSYDPADRPIGYNSGSSTPVVSAVGYTVAGGRLVSAVGTTGDASDSSLRRRVESYNRSGTVASVEYGLCATSCAGIPDANKTVVNTTYDPVGRRSKVTDASPSLGERSWSFTYNTAGDITRVTYPNNTTDQAQWDLTGQLLRAWLGGDGTGLIAGVFGDGVGRRVWLGGA